MINVHIGSRKLVNPTEIKFLEAEINYTIIHLMNGKKILVSTTMGIIERRLPEGQFLRVNRREVVNKQQIILVAKKGEEIYLSDNSRHQVSRRRRQNVIDGFGCVK